MAKGDITVRLNRSELQEVEDILAALAPDSRVRAIVRAMNRTAKGVRTDISREVRAKVNLKVKDMKDATTLWLANRNRPGIRITVSGKRRRLMLFGARQTRTGVSVQVYKDRGRKIIPRAFVNTGRQNGRQDVFWRAKGSDGKLVGRTPIKILFGLSIPEVFDYKAREVVEGQAKARLFKELTHEVDYLLKQAKQAAADQNDESNDTGGNT